ncbi:Endonuclease/Exonuclease/phosphatase family protein [Trichomonas vaginalis G3]|uniref:Endonuclease/Exonuclease/phosphatase family protein n=1 Tax=Trichomonas vaginalis (strain ATCC PRA-98 / G3) TaxID=412133 RepID=A2DUR0_TRIV3|nr:phosphatidylinositol-4,5-bisphosphate 5-phosphatase protein [Trichomonas vaginalis G3]EAY15795.1 Endonuclease/Exonuclease/phosphatase family protein [Trichomonas vaginalis G3]KAI5525035.1 phosphatidylinositol-4,5-bisphosphate 5-phosphatase protein [Trichomonas vaginalis G3]|eukprot:XP_001328018.1 Endonuclease/Exonuclease/phosphatase family protein [Trichomonas vaginalis G3]
MVENTAFLRTIAMKQSTLSLNALDSTESSIATPISLSKTAHAYWESMMISQNKNFFLEPNKVRISILTWNVAGNTPDAVTKEEFEKTFTQPAASADIVVIAIEEIEMSVKYLVTGSTNHRAVWTDIIKSSPEAGDNSYFELACMETVGTVYIAVLVRKDLAIPHKVGPTTNLKLGVAGLIANKAAVLIPITVGEAKIMVATAHLEAHAQNLDARIDQLHQIFETIGESYDYIFIAGDLNFRVVLPYETAVNFANNSRVDQLLQNDQLKQAQHKDPILSTLNEAEIRFNPTYKFDNNSDVYDTSQKKRVPSYTDRILYKNNPPKCALGVDQTINFETDAWKCFKEKGSCKFLTDCNFNLKIPAANYPCPIECVCYRSLKSKFSDHRPVLGNFKLIVPVKNQDKFDELQQIIRDKYEEIVELCKPCLNLEPSIVSYNGEKEKKVKLINTSYVWANWSVKEVNGKFNLSPTSGILTADQSIDLTISFNDDFSVTDSSFTLSVLGGNNLIINFNREAISLEPSTPETQRYQSISLASLKSLRSPASILGEEYSYEEEEDSHEKLYIAPVIIPPSLQDPLPNDQNSDL